MSNCTTLLALSALFTSAAAFAQNPSPTASLTDFHYNGAWVNPYVIKAFIPWVSDTTHPEIVAIDLSSATGSNEFFGDVKADPKTNWVSTVSTNQSDVVSYHWDGVLKQGSQVVEVIDSTAPAGGSGSFSSVLFLDFHTKKAMDDKNAPYTQGILWVNKYIPIGDRRPYTLTMAGDHVTVKFLDDNTSKSYSPN